MIRSGEVLAVIRLMVFDVTHHMIDLIANQCEHQFLIR